MDQIELVLLLSGIFLVAGTVKGAVGIGLPTVSIGVMTLVLDPRSAIAFVLLPMLSSNLWQVYRQGQIRGAIWRYLPFALSLAILIALTVLVTREAPDQVLFGVLGGVILLFVAMNMVRLSPVIPAERDKAAQILFGAVGGVLGGLAGVWGPPMVMYLTARATPKEEFVRATGLLILAGSIPLAIGYAWNGDLTAGRMAISALLILPTFAGFALGETLRRHLSEAAFKRLLLWVFLIMGLNLIRRAVFG